MLCHLNQALKLLRWNAPDDMMVAKWKKIRFGEMVGLRSNSEKFQKISSHMSKDNDFGTPNVGLY